MRLTCRAIASKSGHSPISSLRVDEFTVDANFERPPPDSINLGVTPAVLQMRAARLPAFGSSFHTVQYSILTFDLRAPPLSSLRYAPATTCRG